MDPFISIALFNLAAVTALMTAGWLVSVFRRNVTIVDSLWGLGFVLVAGITFGTGSGFTGRSLLILILTAAWGVRLAVHLTWRNWGEGEDHRYGAWREKSGHRFWIVSLLKVFWLQAIFSGRFPWYCNRPSSRRNRPDSPAWTSWVRPYGRQASFLNRSQTGSWPASRPIRTIAAGSWIKGCGPGAATRTISASFRSGGDSS